MELSSSYNWSCFSKVWKSIKKQAAVKIDELNKDKPFHQKNYYKDEGLLFNGCIVDYNIGNLSSVSSALKRVGIKQ